MKISVARNSGFCFGVRRAIQIAEEVAGKNDKPTYVYGQLVHNEAVVNKLKGKGIIFEDKIENIPDNAVAVLRAHGEPGTTYVSLEKKSITGKNLNDATCPLVTLVHNVAKKLKAAGYEVIIFGKHDHPESIGTSFYIRGKDTFIAEKPEYAGKVVEYIKKNNFGKVAIISQTTMSVDGYKKLIESINALLGKEKFEGIHLSMNDLGKKYGFVDTICNPTKQRQLGTQELARLADIMIVVGGKNSSNAKELAHKCEEIGVETHYVQDETQLKGEWFEEKEHAGVAAGASTPDETINKVVEKIREMTEKREKEIKIS
ncbi:4-hydroxy-3-methylbut-2-enyl diphosphate reductase [Candidatus Woesearchaeota archaeon]|nr:4-hydroxy-3-methylbut-2-enyl diphosphate reductase [Candidatus Woesearchaeota archaeon]